jgi:hypothetical protein
MGNDGIVGKKNIPPSPNAELLGEEPAAETEA